ncbi:MAG: PAS domain S-box protein [Vampirovibrionales bacterium]|nr:PAS domain S-box protein [Vampirovibrionales bacterium]
MTPPDFFTGCASAILIIFLLALLVFLRHRKVYSALKKSEELFSSTFYQASTGMVHVRMSDGKFMRANQSICELLDYTEVEFCTKTIMEVTHPEDIEMDFDNTRKIVNGEISKFSIEKRLLKKDGTPVWTKLTAASVARDANGMATYGMAVVEDISYMKEAEQTLWESEERFRLMADAAPVLIFMTDNAFDLIYANKTLITYLGLSAPGISGGKATGDFWKSVMEPDEYEDFRLAYENVCRSRGPLSCELRFKRAEGGYGWILLSAVPRDTPNHIALGFIGSGIDISERKEMEALLEQSKRQAEIANLKKSEFLSLMSHELRTPLHAINGFSEMLKLQIKGPINREQEEYVSLILSNGNHLLTIVNDLLDIAKIEAGKMKLKMEEINLKHLLEELSPTIEELASQKDVHFRFEIDEDIPLLEADTKRLTQILLNLLNNAIKFNRPDGHVILCVAQDSRPEYARITIEDTGIGIPADRLSGLFQKFYQVEELGGRKYEGTGLGLALTKDLVELHGGMITVKSSEGKGSLFTIQMPFSAQVAPIEIASLT